jgi:hypothetical protein
MLKLFITKYIILLTPLIAASCAQIIKVLIKQKGQKLSLKDFFKFTYAGMPSGHSALMTSTTVIIGLTYGFSSAMFAFSFIIALIIINDAVRLRRYLGQHGEIINVLVKELKSDDILEKKYPHLLENIGHTPIQVFAGIGLGILVSVAMHFIF